MSVLVHMHVYETHLLVKFRGKLERLEEFKFLVRKATVLVSRSPFEKPYMFSDEKLHSHADEERTSIRHDEDGTSVCGEGKKEGAVT
jgi:hypothetical protein